MTNKIMTTDNMDATKFYFVDANGTEVTPMNWVFEPVFARVLGDMVDAYDDVIHDVTGWCHGWSDIDRDRKINCDFATIKAEMDAHAIRHNCVCYYAE